jgi:hypothetical protein
MPFYDLTCEAGHEQIDVLLKIGERPPCPECGGPTETLWRSTSANVVGDDIPGGYEVKHGLCHEDGTPRKFYSKSEIHRAAKEKGLVNYVTHVTAPDTDKSPVTKRWV